MRGMMRVLNTPQTAIIKFPYTTSLSKSQYKKEYEYKEKVQQENFNMEKEKQYVKRPQTCMKTRGSQNNQQHGNQQSTLQTGIPNDSRLITIQMNRRKSIDDNSNQQPGMFVRIGNHKNLKKNIQLLQQQQHSEVNPKNGYISTTREAFQDPHKASFVRSQSTKNGKDFISMDMDQEYPFPKYSNYRDNFADWGQGFKLVEKRPELPRHNLKFNGKSNYKEQCEKSDQMWKEIKEKKNFHANIDTQYQKMLKIKNGVNTGIGSNTLNITNASNNEASQNSFYHKYCNSLDRDHLITSKMRNDKKIEEVIEMIRQKGDSTQSSYGFYQGQPILRPKTALETNYNASSRLRSSSAHFETSYKKNFILHQNNRPLYVPYP